MTYDTLIIGAGISGMAIAARLRARGVSTIVVEGHGTVGGCAGYFTTRGFSFDVGATTFVDFGPGGVGGDFMEEIGLGFDGELLPGYIAWMPDRTVTLFRDRAAWHRERLHAFGDTPGHRAFWKTLDRIADVFWKASRCGISLPFRSLRDVVQGARAVRPADWALARYLRWRMGDALRACGLHRDIPLRSLLGMLIQDTVHGAVDDAPLINSALGVTIRGAGLTRPAGGARGFWKALVARYREMGGALVVGRRVEHLRRSANGFIARTRKGEIEARTVVSTLPIWNSARLGLREVASALSPYIARDEQALGGAVVMHLGVPDREVSDHDFTHHQILADYDRPLGDGNNMFVSVSAPGDLMSAPAGYRAVMISTHCDLETWECGSEAEYDVKKTWIRERLLRYARRVYPRLGEEAIVLRVGTPRTYERFTGRWRGAVGGTRLTLLNSNMRAVPHDVGVHGFFQGGDTTWPGLGTVACVLASGRIAEDVRDVLGRKIER